MIDLRNQQQPRQAKPEFAMLTPSLRRRFVETHPGFLRGIVSLLATQGLKRSFATVSRTFHCLYRTPSPAITRAVEEEYQRVKRRYNSKVA